MAVSISSVVIGPPRSLTGLGVFGGRFRPAAMPLRISSAIASFSFFCSCTARILTARMRSSGRSSVVFTQPEFQKAGFLSTQLYRASIVGPQRVVGPRVRDNSDFVNVAAARGLDSEITTSRPQPLSRLRYESDRRDTPPAIAWSRTLFLYVFRDAAPRVIPWPAAYQNRRCTPIFHYAPSKYRPTHRNA